MQAGLDILRPEALSRIAAAFRRSRVVVLRGPSGQGKSTLAYRYAFEAVAPGWSFRVRFVEGRDHAAGLSKILAEHARTLRVPLLVLVDVSGADTGWPELVSRLAEAPEVQVLVAIREEDWQRERIGARVLYEEIEVGFHSQEAEAVYRGMAIDRRSVRFRSFTDAWEAFGGAGPLLEFVHLITQGTSLKERLQEQVSQLASRVTARELPDKTLEFLELVCVAGAFSAPVVVEQARDALGVRPYGLPIAQLEREFFLLHYEPDGFVSGLHPLRSRLVLDELLHRSGRGWAHSLTKVLPNVPETELGTVLLGALFQAVQADHVAHTGPSAPDPKDITVAVADFRPRSWTGWRAVLRALLWSGLEHYREQNGALLKELIAHFPQGWWIAFDADLADAAVGDPFGQLLDSFSAQREKFDAWRARQTPKSIAFEPMIAWLAALDSLCSLPPFPDEASADWVAVGEVLFWIGRGRALSNSKTKSCGTSLENAEIVLPPIESLLRLPPPLLVDVLNGLRAYASADLFNYVKTHRQEIQTYTLANTPIVSLEESREVIYGHYLLDLQGEDAAPSQDSESDPGIHPVALDVVDFLLATYPEAHAAGCQGYGHRSADSVFISATCSPVSLALGFPVAFVRL